MQLYNVENRFFKTKSKATQYFTELLYKYPLRKKLSAKHESEVYGLLDYHPDIAEKTHMEIDRIEIWANRYGRRSFRLIYIDGSNDDFSIRPCIANMMPTEVGGDQLTPA